MKKRIFFGLLALVLVASFVACKQVNDSNPTLATSLKLSPSKYVTTSRPHACIPIEFKSDGTYSGHYDFEGGAEFDFNGAYQVIGDVIILHNKKYTYNSGASIHYECILTGFLSDNGTKLYISGAYNSQVGSSWNTNQLGMEFELVK